MKKNDDWKVRAEQEQKELKERLVRLVGFINSKDYFDLNGRERSLLETQRAGMEIYLSSLTQRLYGDDKQIFNNAMLPLLMLSMSGIGSGFGNTERFDAFLEDAKNVKKE